MAFVLKKKETGKKKQKKEKKRRSYWRFYKTDCKTIILYGFEKSCRRKSTRISPWLLFFVVLAPPELFKEAVKTIKLTFFSLIIVLKVTRLKLITRSSIHSFSFEIIKNMRINPNMPKAWALKALNASLILILLGFLFLSLGITLKNFKGVVLDCWGASACYHAWTLANGIPHYIVSHRSLNNCGSSKASFCFKALADSFNAPKLTKWMYTARSIILPKLMHVVCIVASANTVATPIILIFT